MYRVLSKKEEKTLYQKVDTNLNFVDREKKVEEFWKDSADIFQNRKAEISTRGKR